jgi:hypothetical protein
MTKGPEAAALFARLDDMSAIFSPYQNVGNGSAGGEACDPLALPWCFDGALVVVDAGPGDGFGGEEAGQDGETGHDGAGAANAAAAGNFDPLTCLCTVVEGVDVVDGVLAMDRQEEVGPVDPLLGPGQLRLMALSKSAGAEIEAVVGGRASWCGAAESAAADPATIR